MPGKRQTIIPKPENGRGAGVFENHSVVGFYLQNSMIALYLLLCNKNFTKPVAFQKTV
jgi:hypothetical protein